MRYIEIYTHKSIGLIYQRYLPGIYNESIIKVLLNQFPSLLLDVKIKQSKYQNDLLF